MDLPRTAAAVRRGLDEGVHMGAQVVVSLAPGRRVGLEVGDAGPGTPVQPDTLWPWLSATKPVSAVAVLQQWERGRLGLDDAVARHVPEFAAAGKAAVTVRHLLTHTVGLAGAAPAADDPAAVLEASYAAPLLEGWVPGRRAAYSPRLGYAVLGEVVRRLDGRAFDAYVSEEVFEPLGMADSWLALPPARRAAYGARLAVLHDTSGAHPQPAPALSGPDAFASPLASSSGVGPLGDLVRFYEMLLAGGVGEGGGVLSAQAVEAMCARHRAGLRDETFGAVIDWGLGVMVNSWHYRRRSAPYGYGDHASLRSFGHGGSQSSVAFADPDAGLAAAVAFNGMPGEAAHHRRSQPVLTALYEDLGLVAAGA
ncbi:MAG: beta-lactamase family protein [Actinomycetota bacterium]|nr:beta-lactamase family protein [Actinomycetota bacterium]